MTINDLVALCRKTAKKLTYTSHRPHPTDVLELAADAIEDLQSTIHKLESQPMKIKTPKTKSLPNHERQEIREIREMNARPCENPRIIVEQVDGGGYFHRYQATCQCGWWSGPPALANKKEVDLAVKQHSNNDGMLVMIAPKVITFKTTVSASIYDGDGQRWCWHAHHDCDENCAYWGNGRTEEEAINDLMRIDDIRRSVRADQKEGFPRSPEWLDFQGALSP